MKSRTPKIDSSIKVHMYSVLVVDDEKSVAAQKGAEGSGKRKQLRRRDRDAAVKIQYTTKVATRPFIDKLRKGKITG